MKAIAVVPGTQTIRLVDRPELFITAPGYQTEFVVDCEQYSAVSDLAQAYARWGDHVTALITNRHAFADCEAASNTMTRTK
jgi:hypothetical protein